MHRTRTIATTVAGLAAASAATAGVALAHAPVKTRLPKPNATTSAAVRQVTISFKEAVVTGKFVSIRRGSTAIPFTSVLSTGKTRLTAKLTKPLSPGTYIASWRVRADDGDSETGLWSFKVK